VDNFVSIVTVAHHYAVVHAHVRDKKKAAGRTPAALRFLVRFRYARTRNGFGC
jgi:hypothetical protein